MNAPARLATLEEIEAAVWRELERAASTKGHAWRQCVLATVDGERADARTVVLREASVAERTLTVFTDERSPKVRQILRHPYGTLVAWCDTLGWQLRLSLRLELATSGLAVSSRWARLKMTPAAHDYLSPLPPGTPVDHPAPSRGTRDYFAVITAHVEAVDWLELHAEGHRRALFDGEGARWVAP